MGRARADLTFCRESGWPRAAAPVPAPIVCDTSIGCLWFSDFDGAEAIETHFVVNRAGLMVGWAKY
jgi:hypothetical protein